MILERDRHILYVGSTEERRHAMRTLLEDAKFIVLEAGSSAEVYNKLYPFAKREAQPEIQAVLLDAKLPDNSSHDICRRIKATNSTSGIPIVQISPGASASQDLEGILHGGADAYVAEPVQPAEWLSLLEALIRSHDVEKTLRFQAAASAQLTSSLEYERTLTTIEKVFSPYFADNCFICLRTQAVAQNVVSASLTCTADHLPSELRDLAVQVCSTGQSRFVNSSTIIVPLEVGRRRLGSLIFTLNSSVRSYTRAAVALAEDLADRAALALQNADLFTAQRAAQAALVQSEKLATAGRLSAAIAHEINNPLEAITNLIFLIDTSDEITPTIKGYAEEALSELSRLTHIARQSLGFYRELTGPATFDLNEGIEDTLNIYLKRFDAKHIRIERKYAEDISLSAVKGEIRQVISNLLVNAYDALSEHGLLRIETRGSPDEVFFQVTDSGNGISKDILPHIFEPFYTTKEGTGTGLGLWVSDNIVHKHGGRIAVDSRTEGEHRGTSFAVTLPRVLREVALLHPQFGSTPEVQQTRLL